MFTDSHCHLSFPEFAAQMPAGVAISPDVAKLVNLVELERAGAAVDQAYTANAGREAIAFASASDAWYARTKKYVISMEKVLHDESVRRQRELDDTQQRMHAVVTGPRK